MTIFKKNDRIVGIKEQADGYCGIGWTGVISRDDIFGARVHVIWDRAYVNSRHSGHLVASGWIDMDKIQLILKFDNRPITNDDIASQIYTPEMIWKEMVG